MRYFYIQSTEIYTCLPFGVGDAGNTYFLCYIENIIMKNECQKTHQYWKISQNDKESIRNIDRGLLYAYDTI